MSDRTLSHVSGTSLGICEVGFFSATSAARIWMGTVPRVTAPAAHVGRTRTAHAADTRMYRACARVSRSTGNRKPHGMRRRRDRHPTRAPNTCRLRLRGSMRKGVVIFAVLSKARILPSSLAT